MYNFSVCEQPMPRALDESTMQGKSPKVCRPCQNQGKNLVVEYVYFATNSVKLNNNRTCNAIHECWTVYKDRIINNVFVSLPVQRPKEGDFQDGWRWNWGRFVPWNYGRGDAGLCGCRRSCGYVLNMATAIITYTRTLFELFNGISNQYYTCILFTRCATCYNLLRLVLYRATRYAWDKSRPEARTPTPTPTEWCGNRCLGPQAGGQEVVPNSAQGQGEDGREEKKISVCSVRLCKGCSASTFLTP